MSGGAPNGAGGPGGGAGALSISGGGSFRVSTTEMLDDARALRGVAALSSSWGGELGLGCADVAGLGRDMAACVGRIRDDLAAAATTAEALADALDRSADAYGLADRSAAAVMEELSAEAGYTLGLAALPLALAAAGSLPSMLFTVGASALAMQILGCGGGGGGGALRAWGVRVLRDPLFVQLLAAAVSSVDDAMAGAVRVPYPVERLLGDAGLSLLGVRQAARVVIGAAPGDVLEETPVTVRQVAATTAAAPDGFADLAARVPPNPEGAPQIRIERYDGDGGRPSWLVYFSGTIDPGFVPDGEPWDDTSNVQAVAGADPASVRAAIAAMEAAGIEADDQVILAGHSQGGLVADAVASSGRFTVPEIVTFGSPVGGRPVAEGTTAVAIEHVDDFIPALGGLPLAAQKGGLDRLFVRGPSGAAASDPRPLAAHDIRAYRETAKGLDAAEDPRVRAAKEQLEAVTKGGAAEVSTWRADRAAREER